MKIMFTKFKPTKPQLKMMLNCYNTKNGSNFGWVKILLKQKYKFDDDNLQKLIVAGYNTGKLFEDTEMDIILFNS